MSRPLWQFNGVVLPRNPDSYTRKGDKVNAEYVRMTDGSQRRQTLPFVSTPCIIELNWKNSDLRLRTFISKSLSASGTVKILTDGALPAVYMNCYFDTPEWSINGDVYDTRPGQGGIRQDLRIVGQTDGPYLYSNNPVALGIVSAAQVQSWFGGPSGSNAIDGLPVWNGANWTNDVHTSPAAVVMTNMGTAPWSPVFRLNGPFNTGTTINVAYTDVDGTGQGVTFTWNGANLGAGSYITFDTKTMRCYMIIGGVIAETYTFTVTAPGSTNQPFPYWPPAPPGNFTVTVTSTGGTTATTLDYSNGGTSVFAYW